MIYLICGFISITGLTLIFWKMAIKGQTIKKIQADIFPEMPFEDISFMNGKHQLKGWFIPAKNEIKQSPLIILVHGWGSGKKRMLRYVKPLYEVGYALLLFDVRGHGESDDFSAPTVKAFRDDVIAAIRYAKQRQDIQINRIGVLGHSFGGFGSVLANRYDLGIQALVVDSIPVRFQTIMESFLKRYKLPYIPVGYILIRIMFFRAGISRREMKELDALQALRERKSPVLFIHSKRDDYVPPTELNYVLHHVKVNHLFVESKGHRSSQEDPKFWEHVLPFFEQHLQ